MLTRMVMTMSKAFTEMMEEESLIEAGSGMNIILQRKLDQLFKVKSKDAEQERKGLHASALLASDGDFCLREQVLSLKYKRNKHENKQLPDNLLRIFKEGDCVHEKWQKMLEENGLAIGIEQRGISEQYHLTMTPDAIIEIDGCKYVVEIKSCNTWAYQKYHNAHPTGSKQIQLYMHFMCIPKGFVLCEDKNNQEFKCFYTEYNPDVVRPYLQRLTQINDYYRRKKIPKMNRKWTSKRCMECSMSDACKGEVREVF